MYSKSQSKLLQTLEESVPPLNQDDAVKMMANAIRQPFSHPIEEGLRQGGVSMEGKISTLDRKLLEAMKDMDTSPEALDKVLPVTDKELTKMAEVFVEFDQSRDEEDDLDVDDLEVEEAYEDDYEYEEDEDEVDNDNEVVGENEDEADEQGVNADEQQVKSKLKLPEQPEAYSLNDLMV
ncbi:39 kDa FK506-binding nuclear protein [Scaptodrosophila lebanonensis]|uniref:39 kDa FK506-binding nuclear protein n=1 Tax=Drosophila lebanonensis TaxID=7225 RepID=A0A6J2U5Y8_DROLE|nr:39 kDa FK506-binding nuclear protein [Scaptodrosophila lebanonensis]